MRQETIKAIMNNWTHCSVYMQRALIRLFLERYEEVNGELWLAFLADEFGIDVAGKQVKVKSEIS